MNRSPTVPDSAIPLSIKLWFAFCTLIGLAVLGLAAWLTVTTFAWFEGPTP